jgi:hypothetical protein
MLKAGWCWLVVSMSGHFERAVMAEKGHLMEM